MFDRRMKRGSTQAPMAKAHSANEGAHLRSMGIREAFAHAACEASRVGRRVFC
jgi:hypothetical protein